MHAVMQCGVSCHPVVTTKVVTFDGTIVDVVEKLPALGTLSPYNNNIHKTAV